MRAAIPPDLPIVDVLPALLTSLEQGTSAVLVAPPGAGKTTSVPLALAEAAWLEGRKIIMLAPRRLAARAAAARMASLLGEAVGQSIGYSVRLDSKTSHQTRIEVVTEGIFVRRLLADPELVGVGCVIFDEVHERNLEGDLAIALALDAQSGFRPDLRLLAMSATLDGARVAALLNNAPVVESAGRLFPIETRYIGRNQAKAIEIQAADAAVASLAADEGDVLVFLPGMGEISRAQSYLNERKNATPATIVALHGGLEPQEQDAALRQLPAGQRKIILSSAIAETSLTVPGVRIVIDAGLSRRAAYEPDTGLTSLVTVRVSRAACDQRRGRAGRTASGTCFRLWTEAEMGAFPAFDRPEILEADLTTLALTLAAWGAPDPFALRWLDAPPKPAWHEALDLLRQLRAFDQDGRITVHGHTLLGFGLHPRLGHMIVEGAALGFGRTASYVAAILSERGLGGPSIDVSERVSGLIRDRSARAQKAKSQAETWAKIVKSDEAIEAEEAGPALALAYPERVARARDRSGAFILRNGRGGNIPLESALAAAPFLAIGALQGKAASARIVEAASLSRRQLDALFADAYERKTQSRFEPATSALRGRNVLRLGAIVLEETTMALSPAEISSGLVDVVRTHGLGILNWSEKASALRSRLAWLHQRLSQTYPDVGDLALLHTLDEWLVPALTGVKSLADVDMYQALLGQFDWQAQQKMQKDAPEWFVTTLGRHLIDYAPEQGPTVSIRVQEVFGTTHHPLLADGQVPLVFQLLSPAHKPVALTANLPNFWLGGWVDVRRDMKARYPKHPWPEDPSTSSATLRVKPKP